MHKAYLAVNIRDIKRLYGEEDYEKLTTLAKCSYSGESEAQRLREKNRSLSCQIWSLQSEVSKLRTALWELTEKCRPYLERLKIAPQKVKEFICGILEKFKKHKIKYCGKAKSTLSEKRQRKL